MQYNEILLNDLDNKQLQDLAGVNDSNIKLIASLFDIDIILRGYRLLVSCDHDTFNKVSDFIEVIISYIKEDCLIDENIIRQTHNNLFNIPSFISHTSKCYSQISLTSTCRTY